MSKKKKVILIISIAILVLAIIVSLIYFIKTKSKTENIALDGSTSKIAKLYSELIEKQAFSFTTTLDDDNKMYYAKKDEMAYIDTTYQGTTSKFIIKDGNSYLLVENRNKYYTYQNNEIDLEKITLQLEEIQEQQYSEGKETIENEQYKYEEYEMVTDFLMKNVTTEEEQTAKTRFYFDGNKLVYIKTIIGEYQEILKVDISYSVDDSLFEIPSDYQEG
jgi:hypothetical protein